MKLFFLFILFNYSLSSIVFPLKTRENEAEKYKSPINQTKISIDDYLYHIINHYEFVSEIEAGTPKQKVEVTFDFYDDYLTLLGHVTSEDPYFYNMSTTYVELIKDDPNCNIQVLSRYTIQEILYLKNGFYSNLNDFISSKDEIPHNFTIIFSKVLPKINYQQSSYKYISSNGFDIGILVNTRYNDDHGIYKPFLNELREQGYMENQLHFIYFFDKYVPSFYNKTYKNLYEALIVFGKHPHELLPDKYDIKNLSWTDTYLSYSEYIDYENIEWGFSFNQVYIDWGDNKKVDITYLRSVFDLNVEFILPPFQYYEKIKEFFDPLKDICFSVRNTRNFNKDGNIYRMVYCDYEEFGKNHIKTFPRLVFRLDDFNEEFEFTYEDLFKPVYNNKYYLFLIFMRSASSPSDMVKDPPTWYLGRMFLKKYQFVFDALNKKIGYYKVNINEDQESDSTTDEKTDEITDSPKEEEDEKGKETDDSKEKEETTDDNGETTDDKNKKTDESNNNLKEDKTTDIIFTVLFFVVLFIIFVAAAVLCYKWLNNKDKRKKRANELIDDAEYNPETKEEEKIIN